MKMLSFISVLLLSSAHFGYAQSPSAVAAGNKKPVIKKTGETSYQIGKIAFDSKSRVLEIPATLEQDEVLLEYLLVTAKGKIHESLLVTEASPYNLNIALKLLGYKESKELLRILKEDQTPSDQYFQVAAEVKAQARFDVEISWTIEGKTTRCSLPQIISVEKVDQENPAMPTAPWVYHGSYLLNGQFKPELSGDIFAIFTDRAAIANFSGDGHEDDTIWLPNAKVLPPRGTPITLTIKPWKK